MHLLQKRKPNAPPEWLKKIPDMARRLEDSLYRRAPTKEVYQDMNTLKQRLHGVAQTYQRQRSGKSNGGSGGSGGSGGTSGAGVAGGTSSMHRSSEQRASSQGGNMVPSGQHRDPRLSGSGGPGGVPGVTAPRQQSSDGKKIMSKEEQEIQAKQKQQVLRQQQQRLLLLRHASKCKYGTPEVPQTCPATKHCKEMKQLWQHITRCKNQRCLRAHCVSSRYVLSHYNRCKENKCAVCKPVRDAIDKHKQQQRNPGAGGQMAQYVHRRVRPSSFLLCCLCWCSPANNVWLFFYDVCPIVVWCGGVVVVVVVHHPLQVHQ